MFSDYFSVIFHVFESALAAACCGDADGDEVLLTRVLSSGTFSQIGFDLTCAQVRKLWCDTSPSFSGLSPESITADLERLFCFKLPCKTSVDSFWWCVQGKGVVTLVVLWGCSLTTFSSPELSGPSFLSPGLVPGSAPLVSLSFARSHLRFRPRNSVLAPSKGSTHTPTTGPEGWGGWVSVFALPVTLSGFCVSNNRVETSGRFSLSEHRGLCLCPC